MSMANLPKNASEAESVGSKLFFDGIPCKRGHIGPRYTNTNRCKACLTTYAKEYATHYQDRRRDNIARFKLKNPGYFKLYSKKFGKRTRERRLDRSPWDSILRQAKVRAKKLGLKFDLTEEWASREWT